MNSYKSTLSIVVGFILISSYLEFRPLFILAILIGLIAIFSEKANNKIILIWTKLSEILSFIIPNLILSIVFYFFLTPLAIINRFFFNKNSLQLKNNSTSTFITKTKHFTIESLEKIW
jgi:hypothetical protein